MLMDGLLTMPPLAHCEKQLQVHSIFLQGGVNSFLAFANGITAGSSENQWYLCEVRIVLNSRI